MRDAYEYVRALLDGDGCWYKLHEHEPIVTVNQALKSVPELTENLLKTVVFRKKDGTWVLAALPHDARVDYKKLADAVGVNRKSLRTVPPADVETELGFQVGGVGPFAVADGVVVVIDDSVRAMELVVCGSGINTRTIQMRSDDLIRLAEPTLAPISKPDQLG